MARIPLFVEQYGEIDRELADEIKGLVALAMEPGELDQKTKLLITLALDAYKGAAEGVKVIAEQLKALGATPQEMMEAIRLAYFVAGLDVIKTGLKAFE